MNILQIRELRYNRLEPAERFMVGIFDGLIMEKSQVHNNISYYIKDNYYYFYYDSIDDAFLYDIDKIEIPLAMLFDFHNKQLTGFIEDMAKKYLNITKIKSVSRCEFSKNISFKQHMDE